MLGCFIGGSFGLILGTIGGLSAKLRGRQLLRTVGSAMFQSGGAFGFFLAVGSGIRCDDMNPDPTPLTSSKINN